MTYTTLPELLAEALDGLAVEGSPIPGDDGFWAHLPDGAGEVVCTHGLNGPGYEINLYVGDAYETTQEPAAGIDVADDVAVAYATALALLAQRTVDGFVAVLRTMERVGAWTFINVPAEAAPGAYEPTEGDPF